MVVRAIASIVTQGIREAMNQYNGPAAAAGEKQEDGR